MNNLPILLLFLSIIITTFNRGFFSFTAIILVISIFVILLYLFLKNIKFTFPNKHLFSFQFLFVVVYSLFLFFSGGIYQVDNFATLLLYFLPILSYPLVLTYILEFKIFTPRTLKLRFYSLFSLAAILRILIIIATPTPIIDVFTILKEAPLAFLKGGNPYDFTYSAVYPGIITDYFPYWPLAFILQMPFVTLFGDPRVLLAFVDILAAVGLYFLGKKTFFSQILVLIYLFRPNSNFIIEQSWITPLSYFLLVLAIFILERKKQFLLGIILGLISALQPLYAVLLPFFLILSKNWQKIILGFLATVSIFVTPFFLWNPGKFLDKTIFVYFKPAHLIPTIPVHLSLNLSTALYTFTGYDIPIFISLIFLFLISVFIFYRLFHSKEKDLRLILLGLTVFFYAFYLLFRQAFINYYYFASGLIILWLIKR